MSADLLKVMISAENMMEMGEFKTAANAGRVNWVFIQRSEYQRKWILTAVIDGQLYELADFKEKTA